MPHTADKSIKAFGADLAELFENAAYGMFSLMAELEKHEPDTEVEIEVSADDAAELMKAWLSELLYRFEVEEVLFLGFKVAEISENRLVGTAKGAKFNPGIEWLGSIVKAVTYHDLEVKRTRAGWEARIVFDV